MNRFIDPIAQIIVKNPATGKIWNWTAPDYPFLTGVKIEIQRMRESALSFDIDAPYTLKILDDLVSAGETPFNFGNLVSGRIGYATGGWTPWYSGIIADGGQGITVNANGISGTIDVHAVAGEVASANIPTEILIRNIKGFESFMRDCCTAMGMTLVITAKAADRADAITSKEMEAIGGDKKMMSFVGMPIWDVIKKVCKEFQLIFFTSNESSSDGVPSKMYIMTEDEGERTDAIRTYMIRGIIDEANNQYPCFEFSPSAPGLAWKANEPMPSGGGVTGMGLDKETGDLVSVDVAPQDQEVPIVGAIPKNAPENTSIDGNVSDILSSKRPYNDFVSIAMAPGGIDRLTRIAIGYQSQGNPAQTGTITTLGIPEESTLHSCNLKGAGGLFDGIYLIEKLSHSYAPGTWDMSMDVKRFGSKGVAGKQLETKGGQLE